MVIIFGPFVWLQLGTFFDKRTKNYRHDFFGASETAVADNTARTRRHGRRVGHPHGVRSQPAAGRVWNVSTVPREYFYKHSKGTGQDNRIAAEMPKILR